MKVTDLKENEVIHCETEEQANAICKLMHESGLKWNSGDSYLEINNFSDYKENTCYNVKKSIFTELGYSKKNGYTIYKAEQFLNTKTMTKTRVLFEEVEEKKLKPIEFKKILVSSFTPYNGFLCKPNEYDELILITKKYDDNLDIILAKKKENLDVIYLGHWNDGVVE